MSSLEAYIVRGATMRCQYGTHARKINLPVSHGAYYKGKPLMNQGDYKPENVPHFGICASPSNPSGETIYLVSEQGETIQGKPCLPVITACWNQTKADMLVGDQPALTSASYLICQHLPEGCIYFEKTGQEDE
ncbi:DUF4280 domain-containing protein [Paenibacillus durus]|uniref:DUF4280 domain-containing protein n=1 Tax=Paenibacillus durus ATCC 35681 TaxID=1333534 RepID=A0A0F7FFD3_PAEDU|nr:DUF4280 domain-containing protein [Paenibacillus durus]AKG37434.1 hypothetical protein VK70_25650 [Paenibacillus durus ATCC 35681]